MSMLGLLISALHESVEMLHEQDKPFIMDSSKVETLTALAGSARGSVAQGNMLKSVKVRKVSD